jgi:hypothetical protein
VRLLTEFSHQRQFFRARFSMHSGQQPSIGGYSGFFTSSYATAGQREQFVQKCQCVLAIPRRYRALMITPKTYHN